MNNNIDRITKGLAQACKECIDVARNDASARKEIMRGGGSSGGIMTRLMMPRPISKIRISEDALKCCLEHDVLAFDYFILTPTQVKDKYGNFFGSNRKVIEECHRIGHYLTGDHNIPNTAVLEKMFELDESSDVYDYREILNEQSLDLITVEENKNIENHGLKASGAKEARDNCCSPKMTFVDLWLTPEDVIEKFFTATGLDRDKCLDPCASDGRWLKGKGLSMDIIPMKKGVVKQNFLTYEKTNLPENIKTVVGNLPFSLMDDFVRKALELTEDCYFLVNGDTVMSHFPDNIEHLYIFTGLEGKQKDYRSRCEFDVPYLIKSALWCCIVHITRKKQPRWNIERNLSNDERRDGYHIALGKNTFVKLDNLVENDKRVTQIPVTSSIIWKGGKKIITPSGIIDGRNFDYLKQSED